MLEDLERAFAAAAAARGWVSGHRLVRYLAGITRYSRVQGTVGLLDAAKYVEDMLLQDAGESLEVEIVKFGGTSVPDWMGAPTGWALLDAEVRVGSTVLKLSQHPTLVAAHSPPSGGVVSGEAVVVDRRWWRPESYANAKGKVVVSPGNPYVVYRLAVEAGAAAVALYSPSAPPDAVPYKGLFLSRSEAQSWTIPAVSIPRSLAEAIEGKVVEIRVDADVRRDPGFPIVHAWIGDRSEPGPAAVAHLCHPTPGANDNASGSAAILEAAVALSKMIDSGALPQPKRTIRFVWVPEYTGLSVVLNGHLKGLVTEVVNFDMVGVEEGGGNGPIRVVAGSLSAQGAADASLWLASRAAARASGLREPPVAPYESGSDHDVAAAYGIPAAMMNGWPDVYYHTDLDDVYRISRRALEFSSISALASLHLLAGGGVDAAPFRSALLSEVIAERLTEGDGVGARLAASHLASRLGLQPLAERPAEWAPKIEGSVAQRPPMIGSIRVVARRSPSAASEILELTEQFGGLGHTVYLMEALFLASPGRPLSEVVTDLASVYGTRAVDERVLERVVGALAESRLIELG